ncbi:MAG: 30S ribosomal protein S4 [Eubacteriales bacterium]|nr:30S ribosomal protein S4 [Christensenellaceae bacterium]MDY2751798.1 30S ribosomal protein S4 [Eubacteriales bacterium]MCI7583777.1 30S ribosomal protein S4 [Christensenellaceae bacterium]MCI7769783.1 30S ribosomal protein S4 [Christensenellaceae bacterium]MDD6360274.1 30S ribosomal protein S4 [Christensenellaceae bacterium]
MAKYTGPVLKKCRALGISPMELGIDKKSNRQVKVSRKKQSNYALQLKEKQKVKFIYGILEKQFRMYYNKAERMRGVTGENMLVLIESRLDNVVYRLGLGSTRAMARQIVNHGHITVNGRVVNIPSYLVKAGDVIAVKANKQDKVMYADIKEGNKVVLPAWLSFDNATLAGKVERLPERADIDQSISEHLIVELYSK